MKQTKKYIRACETATLNHTNQEDLYHQLNDLGFFWSAKAQRWERDDRLAEPPSELIKIRLWADSEKINDAADLLIQSLSECGLKLQEKSEFYPCRPPKQKESRIYLSFRDPENRSS